MRGVFVTDAHFTGEKRWGSEQTAGKVLLAVAEGPSPGGRGHGDQGCRAGCRAGSSELLPGPWEAPSGAFCGEGLGVDCPHGRRGGEEEGRQEWKRGMEEDGGLLQRNSSLLAIPDNAANPGYPGQPESTI